MPAPLLASGAICMYTIPEKEIVVQQDKEKGG